MSGDRLKVSSFPEKLRTQRAARQRRLEQALKATLHKLREMGAIKIILFGSYASGIIRRWSELDMIVIMPSTKSGKEWFKDIYDRVDVDLPVDIPPFTREEFERKIVTSSFIRYALKTGKVLYDGGG